MFVMIALSSCRPHIQETDAISERGPDSIYAAYLVMARSLPDSLGKIAPYVATERDSGTIYEVLDSPYLAIGRLIDTKHVFVVSCTNDTGDRGILTIYSRDNGWHQIGRFRMDDYAQFISFIDADGEPRDYEILVSGFANMNGNRRHYIYKYDPAKGVIRYSGNFFCSLDDIETGSGCKINTANRTIAVDCEGSNTGVSRSLYLWRDDSLVLLRECYIANDIGARILIYSVNRDTCFSCGLTKVFSENDNNDKGRHHKKYWDHFFDLK